MPILGGIRVITIEQIDEFRKRTHSSYEDAKYYLEKNNGDILEAIIDFERTKTAKSKNYSYESRKRPPQHEDYGKKFGDFLQKGFDTKIVVEDKNSVLFTFPVILLLLLIPMWVIVVIFFAFLLILGYKITLKDVKSQNVNINSFFQNVSEKVKEQGVVVVGTKKGSAEQTNAHPVAVNKTTEVAPTAPGSQINGNGADQNKKDDEDGYKEFTIE